MTNDLDLLPGQRKDALALGAVCLLGALLTGYPGSAVFAIGATTSLVIAMWRTWPAPSTTSGLLVLAGPLMAVAFVAYGWLSELLPATQTVGRDALTRLAWVVPVVVLAGVVAYTSIHLPDMSDRRFTSMRTASYVLLAVIVAAMGAAAVFGARARIDVLFMHFEAAQDLWAGLNPYESVVVPDTDPYAPAGSYIEGYVYTPTVLATYSVAWRLFGDPRWATVLSVAAFVLLLVRPWSVANRLSHLARISTALIFVSFPALELVFNRGWTDLLAAPFLLASSVVWRRNPVAAAVLLGVALSTKEYFVVLAPLLLLLTDSFRWKRALIVMATVLLTYAPFVLSDIGVLFRQSAALGEAAVRPDSLGFAGLGIAVPSLVSLALGMAVAVVASRGKQDLASIWLGAAAVFAVVFTTGFQAFINYWIFIVALILMAVHLHAETSLVEIDDRRAIGV